MTRARTPLIVSDLIAKLNCCAAICFIFQATVTEADFAGNHKLSPAAAPWRWPSHKACNLRACRASSERLNPKEQMALGPPALHACKQGAASRLARCVARQPRIRLALPFSACFGEFHRLYLNDSANWLSLAMYLLVERETGDESP